MVITMISVSIIACEKEKEKSVDDGGTPTYISVEGTWSGTQRGSYWANHYTFVFKTDGTGTYACRWESTESGNGSESGTFIYIMSSANGGIIIANHKNDYGESFTEQYFFGVDNDKLYLVEGDQGVALTKNSEEGFVIDKANKSITGTWRGSGGESSWTSHYTFVFKTDGTGTFVNRWESTYSGNDTDSGILTYILTSDNGGIVTMRNGGGYPEAYYFAFTNNKVFLVLRDDGLVLSKTSEDNFVIETATKSMSGTWKGSGGGTTWTDHFTFVFKTNGTGTYNKRWESTYSGSGTESGIITYVMTSANGGIMMLKDNNGYTDSYYFGIKNDKFYLLEGENEFVLSK